MTEKKQQEQKPQVRGKATELKDEQLDQASGGAGGTPATGGGSAGTQVKDGMSN